MSLKDYFNGKPYPDYSSDPVTNKSLTTLETIEEKLSTFYGAPISSPDSMQFDREVWVKRAEEIVRLGKTLQKEISDGTTPNNDDAKFALKRISTVEKQLNDFLPHIDGM